MELLLNLFWMVIAVSLIGMWRARWVHQRRRTLRHSIREWSAVSVALVLLFFAVSMSDDLHSEIVALVESSSTKRNPIWSPGAIPLPRLGAPPHAPVAAVVPRASAVVSWNSVEKVSLVGRRSDFLPVEGRHSGRAPPVSSL
jgi:hypothetical protein